MRCCVRARIGGCLPARGGRAPARACAERRRHHHRHAARRSHRRLRVCGGAHSGPGRTRAWRDAFQPRICAGADHADVSRIADDRTLSARPRRQAQRSSSQDRRAGPRRALPARRVQDRRLRRGVSARPALRARAGISNLRRPHAARCGSPSERTARLDGSGRGAGLAEDHRRCAVLPLGAPVRTARTLRPARRRPPRERTL